MIWFSWSNSEQKWRWVSWCGSSYMTFNLSNLYWISRSGWSIRLTLACCVCLRCFQSVSTTPVIATVSGITIETNCKISNDTRSSLLEHILNCLKTFKSSEYRKILALNARLLEALEKFCSEENAKCPCKITTQSIYESEPAHASLLSCFWESFRNGLGYQTGSSNRELKGS